VQGANLQRRFDGLASNPTIEGGDFGFPSPVLDGDVIKTAPFGDGNTYPPTLWARVPRAQFIQPVIKSNLSPGGVAFSVVLILTRGQIYDIPSPLYRWIALASNTFR